MTNKFYAHKMKDTKENERRKNLQLKTASQHFVACKFVNTDGQWDGHRDRQSDRQSGQTKKGIWTTQATKNKSQTTLTAWQAKKKVELKKKKYYYSYNI